MRPAIDTAGYLFGPSEPQWYARLSDAKGQKKNRAEPCKRWGHSATIADDKMFIYGGAAFNATFQTNETFYQLDLTNWNWSKLMNVTPSVRDSHSCTAFQDKLYLFGGSVKNESLNDLWEFDLKVKSWKQLQATGDVPAPREGHSACILNDKYLVIYGGWDGNQIFNDCFLYNILQKTWIRVHPRPDTHPITREGHSCCLLRNGLYFFGGQGSSNGSEGKSVDNFSNELYKLEINFEGNQVFFAWEKIEPQGSKPTRRSAHSSCAYKDKYLFIIGGEGYPATFNEENLSESELQVLIEKRNANEEYICHPKNDVWCYDVDTNTWVALKVKNDNEFEPRFAQTCTIYQNSIILFGGLKDYDNCTNDVYILSLDGSNPFVPKPLPRAEQTRMEEVPAVGGDIDDLRLSSRQPNRPIKPRADFSRDNLTPVSKQEVKPETRREIISAAKAKKNWPIVSSTFSNRIANIISWPLAPFGLLVDNAVINKATNLKFTFVSKPIGATNTNTAFITITDDGKGWRHRDFINIIMNYDTDTYDTLHYEGQPEDTPVITSEDRVNEYALNLKAAGFRLGSTIIYINQNSDEICMGLLSATEPLLHCAWRKATGEHLTDNSDKSKATIIEKLEGVLTEDELLGGLETISTKIIVLNLFEIFTLKLNEPKQKNYELYLNTQPDTGNDIMVAHDDQHDGLLPHSLPVIELSLRTYLRYFFLDNSQVNMKVFINEDAVQFANLKEVIKGDVNQPRSVKLDDKGLYDGTILLAEKEGETDLQEEGLNKKAAALSEREHNQGILLYFHNRLVRRLENPKLGDLSFLLQSLYNGVKFEQHKNSLLGYYGYVELTNFFRPNLFKTEIENPYFSNYLYSTIMHKLATQNRNPEGKRERMEVENTENKEAIENKETKEIQESNENKEIKENKEEKADTENTANPVNPENPESKENKEGKEGQDETGELLVKKVKSQ